MVEKQLLSFAAIVINLRVLPLKYECYEEKSALSKHLGQMQSTSKLRSRGYLAILTKITITINGKAFIKD